MIDAKLRSKLAPIQGIPDVREVHLVRRTAFAGEKVTCYTPPGYWPTWLPAAEAWRVLTLMRLARTLQPECLVGLGVIPNGIYCYWVARLLGLPFIVHSMGKNDFRTTFRGQGWGWLSLRAMQRANLVAVRGSESRRWLRDRGIPEERIFVQQNVHDFDLFAPEEGNQPTHDLVYVGLLAPYKRVDLMLEVVAKVNQRRPNTTLLVVGDGPLREGLERRAVELGIEEQVTFAGSQPFETLPGFYRRGRVFIMTSQGEGLPMALVEALSCGLPGVVPADADILDLACDGVNSVVVPTGDAARYAEVVERLLADETELSRLRMGALQIRSDRKQEFSLTEQIGVWQDAIGRAVAAPRR